jgi:hypothetical protein
MKAVAFTPLANVSLGFQLPGAHQDRHACVDFFGDPGSNSNPALLKDLHGVANDSCDLPPARIAEGQEQLIEVGSRDHSAASIRALTRFASLATSPGTGL